MMSPVASTMTIASGAASRRPRNFASVARSSRSVLSWVTFFLLAAMKRTAPSGASTARIDTSTSTSVPSLRRLTVSNRAEPVRRTCARIESASRRRSGGITSSSSVRPRISGGLYPKSVSAPRLQ
jgi:hypothetical protein